MLDRIGVLYWRCKRKLWGGGTCGESQPAQAGRWPSTGEAEQVEDQLHAGTGGLDRMLYAGTGGWL